MKTPQILVDEQDQDLDLRIYGSGVVVTKGLGGTWKGAIRATRVVAARMLGGQLKRTERVSLRNSIQTDLRRQNLLVVSRKPQQRILVSEEDQDLNLKLGGGGRVYVGSMPRAYAPRVIIARKLSRKLKKSESIIHKNRSMIDVRRCNLAVVTRGHCQRAVAPQKGGTSQYKGVHWAKQIKRWRAKIVLPSGKVKSLGCYGSEREAALAYDDAVRELNLPHAFTNSV